MVQASTVDFFTSQDVARKKTFRLIILYFLAVAFIILAVYLAFAFLFLYMAKDDVEHFSIGLLWHSRLFAYVIGGTLLVVVSGTLYKIAQLRSGGSAVAEMLGGRLVEPHTRDINERKLLNVVQEMAIASGTPVPPVYVLDDEQGMNAFAAGFSVDDAVVAVTKGTLEQLNRDELQGVIGHEFSHILNGDMKMNIKLTGILHGILVISLIGYTIMRVMSRSRGSSRGKGGAAILVILLLGFLLWLIGYIGVLFGKLIKSAVSRQREYLADASSVQFTRNPLGIANALKKIGGFAGGSKLETHKAEEASHFFFADGMASFFHMFDTHPPLVDRIRRLDPQFDGDYDKAISQISTAAQPETTAGFAGSQGRRLSMNPRNVVDSIGRPSAQHLDYAVNLFANLPLDIVSAVRSTTGAKAVVFGLLLSNDEAVKARQTEYIKTKADATLVDTIDQVIPKLKSIGIESRLPLVDLAIPSLKLMDAQEFANFKDIMEHLALADNQVDLFEYALELIVRRRLESAFQKHRLTVIQYYSVKNVIEDCGLLMSCLSYWGADTKEDAQKAYDYGMQRLQETSVPISNLEVCGLPALDKAINVIKHASPQIKKLVIDACVSCIGCDGTVTIEEAELMRVISDGLECPMPPIAATSSKAA